MGLLLLLPGGVVAGVPYTDAGTGTISLSGSGVEEFTPPLDTGCAIELEDGSGFVDLEVCVPAGKSKTQKLYPGVYKPPFRTYTGPKIPVEYGVVPEIAYMDRGHGTIRLFGSGVESHTPPPFDVLAILAEMAAHASAREREAELLREREEELTLILASI